MFASRRLVSRFLIVAVAAVAVHAVPAHAADPKLDVAQDHISQAIASLEAASVPEAKGQRCRKQTDKAVKQLRKVEARIAAAKGCADGTAPPAKAQKKGRKPR